MRVEHFDLQATLLEQVRHQIIDAAETIAVTYGPKGKYALVCPANGRPYFTRDGVTVAKNLDRTKPGVNLLVDACEATVTAAGDGTTSTAVLAREFIARGIDPSPYTEQMVGFVKELAFPASPDDLVTVAVGAAHDEKTGRMIAEAALKLGEDGHIRAEHGKEDSVRIEQGYDLGSGALLPQFLEPPAGCPGVSRLQDGSVSIKNPLVLLVEEKIADSRALAPVYEAYIRKAGKQVPGLKMPGFSRPLVIVVGDMEDDALRYVVANLHERKPPGPVFLVKSPAGGRKRYNILTDIRYITGTDKVYSKYSGLLLKQFSGKFGEADEVVLSDKNCRFLVKGSNLQERIAILKESEPKTPERDSRISKLSGAVGVITFGPDVYSKMRNNELRVEDTVYACFETMRHGFIPGGKNFWGKVLAEKFPAIKEPLEAMAARLPDGDPLDSALVAQMVIKSACALAEQFANTGAVTGKMIHDGL